MDRLPIEPTGRRVYRWLICLLTSIFALFFIIGGAILIMRGGSLYYLLMGVALLLASIGILKRAAWGAELYAIAFLATLVWAFVDAGLEF